MTQKICRRDVISSFDVVQQREKRGNLSFRKWLSPIVVEFNSERRRIEIGVRPPLRLTSVPSAGSFIDKLVNDAIAPNEIVGTHLSCRIGQCAYRLFNRIGAGMMNYDEVWTALVKVFRRHPISRHLRSLRLRHTSSIQQ